MLLGLSGVPPVPPTTAVTAATQRLGQQWDSTAAFFAAPQGSLFCPLGEQPRGGPANGAKSPRRFRLSPPTVATVATAAPPARGAPWVDAVKAATAAQAATVAVLTREDRPCHDPRNGREDTCPQRHCLHPSHRCTST